MHTQMHTSGSVVSNASLWDRGEKGVRFIANIVDDANTVNNQRKDAKLLFALMTKLRKRIFVADGLTFEVLAAFNDSRPFLIKRALMFHQ
jgi:hypothetical protein